MKTRRSDRMVSGRSLVPAIETRAGLARRAFCLGVLLLTTLPAACAVPGEGHVGQQPLRRRGGGRGGRGSRG